jgi:hypothetical protein
MQAISRNTNHTHKLITIFSSCCLEHIHRSSDPESYARFIVSVFFRLIVCCFVM